MSEIQPTIGMLYGPWQHAQGVHPLHDEIFRHLDQFQDRFIAAGFNWEIGFAVSPPTGKDAPPEVLIARNPTYTGPENNILKRADFKPGRGIMRWAGIIDHYVANFQDPVTQPDGTKLPTAYGIGVEPGRTWNHRLVQKYGNQKDLMDDVLQEHAAGVKTYSVKDHDAFVQDYGDGPLIFKPQGGASGKGIAVYENAISLRRDLDRDNIPSNGLIQPYLNTMTPPEGLIFPTQDDAERFKAFTREERPYEIRMHVITHTDDNGNLQTETYPVLKVGKANELFMKTIGHVAIDPETTAPGTYLHDTSVRLAQAVCRAASVDERPVEQYYGVFDYFAIDGKVNVSDKNPVGDGNCRGPGLPHEAAFAREALITAIIRSAQRQLEQ